MTEEEAYQILGLEPGAEADAISGAPPRADEEKSTPDQGGNELSWRLASNEAKDTLLRHHR